MENLEKDTQKVDTFSMNRDSFQESIHDIGGGEKLSEYLAMVDRNEASLVEGKDGSFTIFDKNGARLYFDDAEKIKKLREEFEEIDSFFKKSREQ